MLYLRGEGKRKHVDDSEVLGMRSDWMGKPFAEEKWA